MIQDGTLSPLLGNMMIGAKQAFSALFDGTATASLCPKGVLYGEDTAHLFQDLKNGKVDAILVDKVEASIHMRGGLTNFVGLANAFVPVSIPMDVQGNISQFLMQQRVFACSPKAPVQLVERLFQGVRELLKSPQYATICPGMYPFDIGCISQQDLELAEPCSTVQTMQSCKLEEKKPLSVFSIPQDSSSVNFTLDIITALCLEADLECAVVSSFAEDALATGYPKLGWPINSKGYAGQGLYEGWFHCALADASGSSVLLNRFVYDTDLLFTKPFLKSADSSQGFMCSPNSKDLVMKLNRALDKLNADGTFGALCATDGPTAGASCSTIEPPVTLDSRVELKLAQGVNADDQQSEFRQDLAKILRIPIEDVVVTKLTQGEAITEDGVQYQRVAFDFTVTTGSLQDASMLDSKLRAQIPAAAVAGSYGTAVVASVSMSDTLAPTMGTPGLELSTVDIQLSGLYTTWTLVRIEQAKREIAAATNLSPYDITITLADQSQLLLTSSVLSIVMPKPQAAMLTKLIEDGDISALADARIEAGNDVGAPTASPTVEPPPAIVPVPATPAPRAPPPTSPPTRPPTAAPVTEAPTATRVPSLSLPPVIPQAPPTPAPMPTPTYNPTSVPVTASSCNMRVGVYELLLLACAIALANPAFF
jgi:hypothetical protein